MSCFELITKYKDLAFHNSVRQGSHCDQYATAYPGLKEKEEK